MKSYLKTYPVRVVSLLRFRPFDTHTSEGRSKERYRRIALTALSSGGAKVVSMITILVSVPLTLHYLGPERYGMWMTISSVVMMLGFADLGLGLGLMNFISEAHGREDRQAATVLVSSGFFMLVAVGLVILTAFVFSFPFVSWSRLFNVSSARAVREAGPAMAVLVACFAMNLPLGVAQRVQVGYQEGYVNSLWESVGRVLALLGLLLVIFLKGGLVWLAMAVAGIPAMVWGVNSLILFRVRSPWIRPRWHSVHRTHAKNLLKMGLTFFVLNMLVALLYSSDNLIIAQILGAKAVSQYVVPAQMFGLCVVVTNMIIGPLWPAYVEAMARGEMAWARKTLKQILLVLLVVVGVTAGFLVLFGSRLLMLWVGTGISPPFSLLLGLGVWTVLISMGSALSIFLNAARVFRFQIICFSLTLLSCLLGKILLTYCWGLPGLIWGGVIAYATFIVIPYSIYINRLFYRLNPY